jgi:hypothetical protein
MSQILAERADQRARDAAWLEFQRDGRRALSARLDTALDAYAAALSSVSSPVVTEAMVEAAEATIWAKGEMGSPVRFIDMRKALEAALSPTREAVSDAALRDFAAWVATWVSSPVTAYSVSALDGLFSMARDRLAALATPPVVETGAADDWRYLLECVRVHADKFPVALHMEQLVERLTNSPTPTQGG